MKPRRTKEEKALSKLALNMVLIGSKVSLENKRIYFEYDGIKMAVILNPN